MFMIFLLTVFTFPMLPIAAEVLTSTDLYQHSSYRRFNKNSLFCSEVARVKASKVSNLVISYKTKELGLEKQNGFARHVLLIHAP
jgi:ribosomal protein S17E